MDRIRSGKVSRLVGLTLAVAAGTALTGEVAMAQEAAATSDVLEEVVVTTARQREEALQDVPATITALTKDTLEAAGVQRAADFVRLTPGVSMVQSAEVADSQVNIRGINGARDAENSFALIIDGVLQTNPAAFNREYADLQQVEILKGPQGATYGRNAAAGAIIVSTTKPTREFSGLAKVGFAEDSTTTGALVLSGPLSENSGWKIAADYRDTDGYYSNRFSGDKNVDDFEGYNVNARFLFEPSDATTIDVKAHYGEVKAASISFNANFLAAQLAGILGAPLLNEDVNTHNFDFVNNIDPYNNQEAKDISIKIDQDVGFGKLTAWALYSDITNEFGSDGTSATYGFFRGEPTCQASLAALSARGFAAPAPQYYGTPPGFGDAVLGPYTATSCDGTQYQVRDQKDYSIEIRLASDGEQRFRWLGGLYYLNIDRTVGIATGVEDAGRVIPSLYIPAGQPNATEQLVWDNFTSDVYAVFANVAYDITDTVELAVAVRHDREEREVHNLVPAAARTTYFDYNPFDGAYTGGAPLNPALLATGSVPDRKLTFDETQPKVSLSWKATPDFTAYANWGVGFKSGGFNNSGSAATVDLFINCQTGRGPNGETNTGVGACGPGTTNVPLYRSVVQRDEYDKETSNASEIGFKWQGFDKRLSFEAAGFYTKVDDMQFFEFLVGSFGLLRVVNNIDEVDVKGFELALSGKVTDELKLVAGYSRVQSEIKANTSRPNSVGNKSPYTPDYTATFGAEMDVPVGEGGWRVQGSAYYNIVGPTWFHVIQGQDNPTVAFLDGNYTNAQRDKFATVDARVAIVSDHWTIAAIGKNVTNEEYLQEVIPAPEFGGAFIHPGTERRWGLEVGYRF